MRLSRLQSPVAWIRRRSSARQAERITSRLPSLCKFLNSRDEVETCTGFLRHLGYYSHSLACKDWDLAHVVPEIGDGDVLDMGSSDSYVLKNLAARQRSGHRRGQLYGIDLREPDVPVRGVKYIVGDLMDTKLPDGAFSALTCMSVIEHNVDFARFAAESSRLLNPGGRLFVTFDYWEPKITPPTDLYGLKWQPLDAAATKRFIAECGGQGLRPVEEMDWSTKDAVIRDGYFSPHPDASYTFGLAVFEKTR